MKKLNDLIGKLTMNEKRYFNTHIKSQSAIKLFNIINHHPEDTSYGKNFTSREKNYLFNSILRSLREFHSEMSMNRVLDNYVHEIDILINKELLELAMERIKQAEKLTVQYKKTGHQILLIKLKKKVTSYMGKGQELMIRNSYEQIDALNALAAAEDEMERLMNFFREEAYLRQDANIETEMQGVIAKLPVELREGYVKPNVYENQSF